MKKSLLALIAIGGIASIATAGPTVTVYSTNGCEAVNLTAAQDGAIWFDCSFSARVGRLTADGNLGFVTMPEIPFVSNHLFAAAGQGVVYYIGSKGGIYRISAGPSVTKIAVVEPSVAIAFGPDGNLWLTETDADQIARVTPSGTITHFELTKFARPDDIVVGSDGAMWFRTNFNLFIAGAPPTVGRISMSGSISYIQIPSAFGIGSLVNGADGKIYIPSGVNSRLGVALATDGKATPVGYLPLVLTLGPDGKLWTAGAEGFGQFGGAFFWRDPGFDRPSITSSGGAIWFSENWSPPPLIPPSVPTRIVRADVAASIPSLSVFAIVALGFAFVFVALLRLKS